MRLTSQVTCCSLLSVAMPSGAAPRPAPSSAGVLVAPALASPPAAVAGPPVLSGSDYAQLGTGRLTAQARAQVLAYLAGMPLSSRRALDEAGRLRLLVRTSLAGPGLLPAGMSMTPLSRTVAEVRVSAADLRGLLASPVVTRIDGLHSLRPLLDQSRNLIGAQAASDKYLARGKGVLVGIVDTGADFRHADLRDPMGKTRIGYLLSSTEARDGRHPEFPDYGGMQVSTAKDIDEVLDYESKGMQPPVPIRQVDTNGHGTHVAGIAASSGLATSPLFPAGRYVGIAPESTLCIVKATRDEVTFDDVDILLGVRFCLDRAEENKQPVVVNLSLGGPGGLHDGSSLMEVALDELFADRPGRVLVTASGNSGDYDIHAGASLLLGSHEVTLKVTRLDVLAEKSFALLELYYDASAPPKVGGAAELTVGLRSPSGRRFEVPMGQSLKATFEGEGTAVIDASDQSATGKRGVLIHLSGVTGSEPPKPGDWNVSIQGKTRRYDLWQVDQSPDLDLALRGHLDPDGYIGIPASAASAISVGALRSRLAWKRNDGKEAVFDRELGRVATFSSGGPLGSGGFAPDIVAPGEFILSALSTAALQSDPRSSFALPHDPGLLIADDGLHGVLRGTSQAAPHVAGAVALMLEARPTLTTTQVRELLRTTASQPLARGYGPRRGFGQLNVEAVFGRLRGEKLYGLSALMSDVGVSQDIAAPYAETTTVTVTPRDLLGQPLGPGLPVSITSDRGAWLGEVRDVGHGRYERTLLAEGPRGSRATIEVRVGGTLLDQQPVVHFVGERSEIGLPFVVGACAVAPLGRSDAGPSGGLLALLLAGLGLSLRSGRWRQRLSLWSLGLFLGAAGCSESASGSVTARAGDLDKGGDFFWAVQDELLRPRIVIHLGRQQAELMDGDRTVAQSSVCSGRVSHKTPKGSFSVLEKVPQYVSGRYGDYVSDAGDVLLANIDNHDHPAPPGATFRGTPMPYFMRIFGGIGMHAGPLPGFPQSHGCVRFPKLFAQRLFDTVPLGTPVDVVD